MSRKSIEILQSIIDERSKDIQDIHYVEISNMLLKLYNNDDLAEYKTYNVMFPNCDGALEVVDIQLGKEFERGIYYATDVLSYARDPMLFESILSQHFDVEDIQVLITNQ